MEFSNLKVGDKVRTVREDVGNYRGFRIGLEGKVLRFLFEDEEGDEDLPITLIELPGFSNGLNFYKHEVERDFEIVEPTTSDFEEGEEWEPESYGTTFFESEDSATRKEYPIYSGVLKYFPKTMAAVAHCSWRGNLQHNPGEPLHWAREKSTDHEDCLLRHLMQKGTLDSDGIPHSVKVVWRAMAACELELEEVL